MKQDRKTKPRGTGAAPGYGKPRTARPAARTRTGEAAPRPARFRSEEGGARPPRARYEGSATGAPRPPSRFRRDEGAPRPARPPYKGAEDRASKDYGDPYRRAERPPHTREEGGRGFTVTLDPDVARMFRGDASVNKALRLVLQLMQVVEGPRKLSGDRAPRPPREGYQGSAEARGFVRKPRFEEDGTEPVVRRDAEQDIEE